MATSGRTLLVSGGDGRPARVTELDVETGVWRQLADLPDGGRTYHGCTLVGRTVVVAGGSVAWALGVKLGTSFVLDLNNESDGWRKIGDLEEVREEPRLVTVNGRALAIGGLGESGYLDSVEELDMEEMRWRRVNVRMKRPRYSLHI